MRLCYCGYNLHHKGYESMSNHVDALSQKFDSTIITRGGISNRVYDRNEETLAIKDKLFGSEKLSKASYLLALRAQRTDIFHAYSFGPSNWIKYAPQPFVVSISGSDRLEELSPGFLEGLRKSEQVIVESPRMKEELVTEGIKEDKISFILPSIDLSYFKSDENEEENSDKFKVLFASSPLKSDHFSGRGVDLLLEAFEKFYRSHQDTELVLVWRGKETERLQKKLSEHDMDVELINEHVYDMSALYRECSVTVVPYRDVEDNKDMPSSAIESFACGTPVISSDSTGFNELSLGDGCIFHRSGNKESLVEALEKSYIQNGKHSKNARKIAEEHFSIEKEAEKLEQIYRNAI